MKKVGNKDLVSEKQAAFLAEINKALVKISKCTNEIFKLMKEIKQDKSENYKLMRKVVYTNECVSQTLCNVLLAIRQNEYLHPWYPKNGREPAKITESAADRILDSIL